MSAAATLKRLVTEPVGPLVIAILRAEGMMVILGLVDMIEIFLHRRPVLIDNLSVAKLFPDNPRHDNSRVRPAQAVHISRRRTVLSQWSDTGIRTGW